MTTSGIGINEQGRGSCTGGHQCPKPGAKPLNGERDAFRAMFLWSRLLALFFFGISTIVTPAATALPLTPFRYEAQAQRHCPSDTVVWLDFSKERYYFKRQKLYAQGSMGSFVCQSEARGSGFRRSLVGTR